MAERTLEDIYQKKTQHEHILLRPDTYIGSIEKTEALLWIKPENGERFECKRIEYVPGLYKIFDEIIVNAADNFQRDNSTNCIKVGIDRKRNIIDVWNNGQGIPVEIHKEHKTYIPEMIFGELLSGSNFNDGEKKVTGGRNGYGAKLTNIYSKKFSVETADTKTQRSFKMTWFDNMTRKSEPEIKPHTKSSFTHITFQPDLERFGLQSIDDDTYALFCKRVYDLAGVIDERVKVYLNDERVNIKGFKGYVDMYLDSKKYKKGENEEGPEKFYHKQDRWELVLLVEEDQFQQVSFVNAICTSKGGTHVNMIMDQLVEALITEVKKKDKKLDIKPGQIKSNFWIFLNCLIENPSFDSQTKEYLTKKVSSFGSKCDLPEKFIKQIVKSGVIEAIILDAQRKLNDKMKKTLKGQKRSKILGIQKLEDANLAG